MRRTAVLSVLAFLTVAGLALADTATWPLDVPGDYDYDPAEVLVADSQARLLSGVAGTGADGDLSLSSQTFDLNSDASGARTVADGKAWTITTSIAAGDTDLQLQGYAGGLAAGDELLLLAARGSTSTYADAGAWELAPVEAVTAGGLVTVPALASPFDGASYTVFAQRVPNYGDVTLTSSTLTASGWNGATGGVVAFRAAGAQTVASASPNTPPLMRSPVAAAARRGRGFQHHQPCCYFCSSRSLTGDASTDMEAVMEPTRRTLSVLAILVLAACSPKSTCTGSSATSSGGLKTDLATLEFTVADVLLKHRMDVDAWEDGIVAEVKVTLERDDGCRLEVKAQGCPSALGYMPVVNISLQADAFCPGWPQEREGLYIPLIEGPLGQIQLDDVQVPGRERSNTCFDSSISLFLSGMLQNAGTGEPLNIQPTELTVSGLLRSEGDYQTAINCQAVINPRDAHSVDADIAAVEAKDAPLEEIGPTPSLTLKVACPDCEEEGSLRLRGAIGWEMGSPDYFMLFENPTFPFEAELSTATDPTGKQVHWTDGTVTFQVWQDTTPGGAVPEEGEPVSQLSTEELVTGHINLLELTLDTEGTTTIECAPDEDFCLSLLASAHCNESGDDYETTECGNEKACGELSGSCEEVICSPSKIACADANNRYQCLPSGTGFGEPTVCSDGFVCLNGSCMNEECLAEVAFLVDTSQSMALEWGGVAASLASLITKSPTASFALMTFPSNNGVCTLEQQAALGMKTGQSEEILGWFDKHEAFGQTPLLEAMKSMESILPPLFTSPNGALVVLSDGADTCAFAEMSIEEREPLIVQGLGAATQLLFQDHGIRTYVIGYQYQGNPDQLNAIAANGGTAKTTYTEAGNEADLTSVLVAIGQDLKLCFE